MEPIIDPPVPYLGQIRGGFVSGKMVRMQGFASPVGERFDINFQTSANTAPRDDIGLHLSVRLLEGYVARNSIQGGIWGEEQSNGDLPIQPGQKYEIIVLSDNKDFKIAINGKHFCEFPQRIPGAHITHLSIEGDTSLSLISFEFFNVSNESTQAAPPQQPIQTFGPPSSASGQYGPTPGFGGPGQNYGPQPGYGPPAQFGPPGYGPPPPPPGSEDNKSTGLENFLESAGPVIAGVISSGVADKLLTSITGGGGNQQQQSQQPNQQQQQAQLLPLQQNTQTPPQQQQNQSHGGSDVLNSIGSLLSNIVAPQNPNQQTPSVPQQPQQFPQPYQQPPHQQPSSGQNSGSADILGGIGSLLSTIVSPQNPNQQIQQQQPLPAQKPPIPQQQQQQQPSSQQEVPDYLGTIGSLISNYAASQTRQTSNVQPPPHPTPPQPTTQGAHQQATPDYLGAIGSLISNYAVSQNQQKSNVQQPQPTQYPPQQTQHEIPPPHSGNADVIGGITSLLSNLTTTTNDTTQKQASVHPQNPSPNPQIQGIYPQLPDTANSQNQQLPPQQQQQQYQQQQQQQQPAGTDVLGGLGSLLSSFTAPPQPQNTFAPSNVGGQGSMGNMGTVGSLLTTFAGQMLQPPNKGGQPH